MYDHAVWLIEHDQFMQVVMCEDHRLAASAVVGRASGQGLNSSLSKCFSLLD